jgi:hypothetical protein
MFGRILAPSAVIRKLAHPHSPNRVPRWTDSLPGWLTVQRPTIIDLSLKPGPRESAAIALAEELPPDSLVS